MCQPIASNGAKVVCKFGNRYDPVDCSKPAKPGTRVIITCREYYTLKTLNTAVCMPNGHWSTIISCEPSNFNKLPFSYTLKLK